MWELAIFSITIGLLGHNPRVPINFLKISPAFVEQLDQTIIIRQGLRVSLIDFGQSALFFDAIIEVNSDWVGEKEGGESL